jgi:hypothetical protein
LRVGKSQRPNPKAERGVKQFAPRSNRQSFMRSQHSKWVRKREIRKPQQAQYFPGQKSLVDPSGIEPLTSCMPWRQ